MMKVGLNNILVEEKFSMTQLNLHGPPALIDFTYPPTTKSISSTITVLLQTKSPKNKHTHAQPSKYSQIGGHFFPPA